MNNKDKSSDPYRWLEEDSQKTRVWIKKENVRTNLYFAGDENLKKLEKRIGRQFKFDSERLPVSRDGYYFFRYRKASEEQASLYVKEGFKGKPKLLLDVNKISKKYGSIHDWFVNRDGSLIAFNFSKASNDQCSIRIFDVKKKKFLPDFISDSRYPYMSSWRKDSSGFWYVQGDENPKKGEEKYNKKIYFHKLGEPAEKDKLFFSKGLGQREWPSFSHSYDEKYFLVHVEQQDSNSRILFADATKDKIKYTNITGDIKGRSTAKVDLKSEYVYLKTDFHVPNGKILRKKISEINSNKKWEVFISETPRNLENWKLTEKYLFLEYLVDVSSCLYSINLKTKAKKLVATPKIGSVTGYSSSLGEKEIFFSFSSFDTPGSLYRLDSSSLELEKYRQQKTSERLDDIVIKQEWSISKDGTKIPMFIVHKKGLKLNKDNPTLVYAYGGFNSSITTFLIPYTEKLAS